MSMAVVGRSLPKIKVEKDGDKYAVISWHSAGSAEVHGRHDALRDAVKQALGVFGFEVDDATLDRLCEEWSRNNGEVNDEQE